MDKFNSAGISDNINVGKHDERQTCLLNILLQNSLNLYTGLKVKANGLFYNMHLPQTTIFNNQVQNRKKYQFDDSKTDLISPQFITVTFTEIIHF